MKAHLEDEARAKEHQNYRENRPSSVEACPVRKSKHDFTGDCKGVPN
jgi:hypothetical protein